MTVKLLPNSSSLAAICQSNTSLTKQEMLSNVEPSSEIIQGLFLGDLRCAIKGVRANPDGITAILSLVDSPIVQKAGSLPIYYFSIIGENDELIPELLSDVFATIDERLKNNGKLLVHCMNGENRSVGLIIAYLMKKFKIPYEEVYSFMEKKYPKMNLSEEMKTVLKSLCYGTPE